MRPLGWFIKVLLTVIGRLNFYRKFFEAYLPLNISTPPHWEGIPSPFDQSGTLFSNLALEPCLKMRAHGVRCSRSTVQGPHPSHHEAITGESPWNILEERLVSPLFVTHDSRLTHQRSCLAVRCSCSRCSSPSPSTGLCSGVGGTQCVHDSISFCAHIFPFYINDLQSWCGWYTWYTLFWVPSAVFLKHCFFY